MKERLVKLVLAWIAGEHSAAIKSAADSDKGELGRLARHLLGESDEELSEEATTAIQAAVRKSAEGMGPYRVFDPAAVLRLGDLGRWPLVAWEYGGPIQGVASFAQALYVLLRDSELIVRNLAVGEIPHCPMRGNHVFAEAAIALAKYRIPPWGSLERNQRSLVAFARWRSGLEVGNASTFQFMEEIGLRREGVEDDTLLALLALEPDNWAWEAGHRGLTAPTHLPPYAQKSWAEGALYKLLEATAPDVIVARKGNSPGIFLGDALVLYKKYQGNEEILGWIDKNIDDRKVVDPKDPFGSQVSAWELKKREL